ncbi:G-D-S-L family lipolytic protein [Streptomyces viridochromogenes]|uniref:G-D-S-L family lipolytic protein n=1 Tax=Streptomyces viridochromogenes TaxID=1938 RepID=A0A0J7ZCS0_STRVR|nr:SGNH/GDSL hydrolase family protein [Streptomyces viridochromogenes]KMS73896.1 G-D-S-L family lipolytic protein [Streptomyces viridochromogenes]KOG10968.1 G-D-S-L family lipolytic protein [Streptomyces viridochromogenes]KOG26095.1 G-D-S-L family lipolytic protein [Streptomyces viridochromogenes]
MRAALALAAVLLTVVACQSAPAPAEATAEPSGVVTWAASADRVGDGVAGRSYRLVVHTSVGGTGVRVRLSNAFGDRPLTLDSVYAGIQKQGAELRPGSNRRLAFGGARTVTVPAGGTVWSDPLPGRLPAAANLVVSLHSPDAGGPASGHWMALQSSYATQGDHTAEESGAAWTIPTGSWFYLDAVSVRAPAGTGAVVALGDSITDGWQSTADLNRRWPDYLARRLKRTDAAVKGVANEGIAGNKVLTDGPGQSALNRLERDVLSQPGVRTVFLFQGVNDIKAHAGVTAEDLIDGYREIVERAHAAGKCVVGATVGPFKGWHEWDPAGEAVRQEVNAAIRTTGVFDAVTDFDRVLRSPYDPARMLPALDGGDHIHPNDKGMQAMADAVDLTALECDTAP